jgi:hypothetical protein
MSAEDRCIILLLCAQSGVFLNTPVIERAIFMPCMLAIAGLIYKFLIYQPMAKSG